MKRTRSLARWMVAAVIAASLWLTNPTAGEHRASVSDRFRADHPLLGLLGGGHLAAARLDYRSFALFSAGFVDGAPVTVGVAGQVFLR